jgi:hypothetical protein
LLKENLDFGQYHQYFVEILKFIPLSFFHLYSIQNSHVFQNLICTKI